MLDAFWQDLRYALRSLRRSPGFAAAAILSLALGIGANTAIFSLIDALMLQSLPVRHPEELLQVMQGNHSYAAFSNPTWEHLRDRQDVFSGIFAYGRWDFDLATGGEARQVNGQYVSGQYFDTLGVRSAIGRTLTATDDKHGCAGASVLSYAFWQNEYAGSTDILGKAISIDRHPIEIVGVVQRGFNGVEVGGPADVFVPLCAAAVSRGDSSMLDPTYLPIGFLQVMGRLKHGVPQRQATARLKMLAPEIYKATLDDQGVRKDVHNWHVEDRDNYLKGTFDTYPASNGISYLRRQYRQALMILMSIAGMVLLIACANVANLLLARGAAREREIAIRMAVGGGRGRLMRQLLTESLLLSGIGAILGILFAEWSARLLVRFPDASLDLTLDLRVLAFTASVSVLTGLLFGIAPARRGARVQPLMAMKANGRGVIGTSKLGLGKFLVVAQVAMSLLLVVSAGLLIGTFWKLLFGNAGFERDHVLLVTADLRSANYPMTRWSAVYREMLDRLRLIPGVRSASVSEITPVCHCRIAFELVVDGYTPKSPTDAMASFNEVSDRYFQTIGTPILSGRDFNSHDTATSMKVAIISQFMARKYFGARNPLGQHFRTRDGGTVSGPIEIVGVVKDEKYGSLRDEPSPFVFLPWSQSGVPGVLTAFQLRSMADPTTLIPGVKSAIGGINPDVSITFQTLAAKLDDSTEREGVLAALSGMFGALALLLATVGLYGVTSYNIVRRRGEIGIRMALGAARSRVLRMVLGEVAILIGIGLAIGLGAAFAATRLIASFLYGFQPHNPWIFGLAAILLTMVAGIAGYIPARRASRLDPIGAIREE
jgi:putative ABC transport system permease protein